MVSYEYKEGLLKRLEYDKFILTKIINRYADNKNAAPVVESALKELNLVMAKLMEVEQDIAVDNGIMR